MFLAFVDHVVEDVEAVVESFAGDGAGRLHVEDMRRSQFVQAQVFLDLFGVLGAGQVLLVGQHKNWHLKSIKIPSKSNENSMNVLHFC